MLSLRSLRLAKEATDKKAAAEKAAAKNGFVKLNGFTTKSG